jgi:hypothetical protein
MPLAALGANATASWWMSQTDASGSRAHRSSSRSSLWRVEPLPSAVMAFLHEYVARVLDEEVEKIGPETPLFWSTWGRRTIGKTRAPMTGKNIWRLCKVYGRLIGYPTLKPHDLRHGVAMECWKSITTWKRCGRYSDIRASTPPGSTRAFDRPVETSDGVLRNASRADAEPVRMCTRSRFEEHLNVPKTRSEKH